MNKVLIRLLLFAIGLPGIVLVAMWDWGYHLPLALVAILISGLGAGESAALLRTKGLDLNPYLPYALGMLFPTLAYVENAGLLTADQSLTLVALVVVAVFVRQIFANTEENLQPVLGKVTGILFTLIYPGFFVYWILRINSLPDAWLLMPVFLMAVFGNDAGAWLMGSLFGKTSPKPFLVSPSKSVIGFVGGTASTFGVLVLWFYWIPNHLLGTSLPMILGLALVLSLTTIAGDLFESSLKRSARVKDSGDVIPGRGGVLDSIDSLLFSAPLFYLFLQYGRF